MIITIINRDKRFPLSKLGVFYLLPAIAEKKFRLSLIDPAVADLECNTQGQGLPYRFLALQDLQTITTYLRSLMAEKKEKSFFNLWIMDEEDPLRDSLDRLASDLRFHQERAHERRNLLLINEYNTSIEVTLPEAWGAVHNGHLKERFAKGEKNQPYRELTLLILILVEWLARARNRTEDFDNLFQNKSYQLHPDDFGDLQPVFAHAAEQRITALIEQEHDLELRRAINHTRVIPCNAVDTLERHLDVIIGLGVDIPDATAGDNGTNSSPPPATGSAGAADSDLPRVNGIHKNGAIRAVLQPPISIKKCADLRRVSWADFRQSREAALMAMERRALRNFTQARNGQALTFEGNWREIAKKLIDTDLDQVLDFSGRVELKIATLEAEMQHPLDSAQVSSQWQIILDAFNNLKHFCRMERIPSSVWVTALGVIYLLGAAYFGLKIYAVLPILTQLLPVMPSRPYLELAYWFVFAFLPILAGLGIHLYQMRKKRRLVQTLDAAVIGLETRKKDELLNMWKRQKQEMRLSYLRKVRIHLSLLQRSIEETAILGTKKTEFFKALANSLHLKTTAGTFTAYDIPDVLAEYFADGRESCKISLMGVTSLDFSSSYLRVSGRSPQAVRIRFEERKRSTTGGAKK